VTEVYLVNSTTSKDEEILVVTTTNTIEEVAEEDRANNTTEQEVVDTTSSTYSSTTSSTTTSTSSTTSTPCPESIVEVHADLLATTSNRGGEERDVYLRGRERKALVSHLHDVPLGADSSLVLTPKQKLALKQEAELRELGLEPWSDISPWQRLSREEQLSFNEKFLALPTELQLYSKVQFSSLSEDRQVHAYKMFLLLDLETLEAVITRELDKQREVEEIFEDNDLESRQPAVEPDQVRITATQLRQLEREVEQGARSELPRQILEISPEQLKQLGQQLDLIENSIEDSFEISHSSGTSGTWEPQYEEDSEVDLTGVTEVGGEINLDLSSAYTTQPGLEELEATTAVSVQPALYSDDEDDRASTETSVLYHENYFYDQPTQPSQPTPDDDPAEISITTSAPSSVFLDTRLTTLPQPSYPDQTEKTPDKSATMKNLITSDIKKVDNNVSLKSDLESFQTKKIVFRKKKNPSKARKSERQRGIIKKSNSHVTRKNISSDKRLAAWQKRARARLAYDPRRTRRVQRVLHRPQSSSGNTEPSKAERLHFKIAEDQLAAALLLQECLQDSSACNF